MIGPSERWQVIAAAAFGAALASRILGWLEDPMLAWQAGLVGGKTIVSGLIGGWIAVEAVKARIGIRVRTGDLLAIPLAVGIAVGRAGCFLTGLPDQTYGTATMLPWGVDFGDGVRRHPTQLYEIAFVILICGILWRGLKAVSNLRWQTGDVFRLLSDVPRHEWIRAEEGNADWDIDRISARRNLWNRHGRQRPAALLTMQTSWLKGSGMAYAKIMQGNRSRRLGRRPSR